MRTYREIKKKQVCFQARHKNERKENPKKMLLAKDGGQNAFVTRKSFGLCKWSRFHGARLTIKLIVYELWEWGQFT